MGTEDKQLHSDLNKIRYPKVSTAEKRCLLEEAGEPWPVCDCCGLDKVWNPRSDAKQGGSWALRCTKIRKRHRYSQTPETYDYNENHGIGAVGENKKARKRKLYYTPNTYEYNRKIRDSEESMKKYISGTPENQSYIERIYESWQMKLGALS